MDKIWYINGKVEVDYTKRAKTDSALNGIKKMIKQNKESEKLAEEIIKNTYRVLLTRGKCRMHYILRGWMSKRLLKRKIKKGEKRFNCVNIDTRDNIEINLGKSVISKTNALDYKYLPFK